MKFAQCSQTITFGPSINNTFNTNSRWWNVNNANLILVLVGNLRDVYLKIWHKRDIMRQWNVEVCSTMIIDEMVSFIAIHTWNYS